MVGGAMVGGGRGCMIRDSYFLVVSCRFVSSFLVVVVVVVIAGSLVNPINPINPINLVHNYMYSFYSRSIEYHGVSLGAIAYRSTSTSTSTSAAPSSTRTIGPRGVRLGLFIAAGRARGSGLAVYTSVVCMLTCVETQNNTPLLYIYIHIATISTPKRVTPAAVGSSTSSSSWGKGAYRT